MPEKRELLVVDNEAPLRALLSKELTRAGYEVRTASDGDEAIQMLGTARFDLVLLDLVMPKVGGIEVLKFIRKNKPAVKVIMLTAFSNLKDAIESKKQGADDFLSKPYDIVDLVSTIERVLNR